MNEITSFLWESIPLIRAVFFVLISSTVIYYSWLIGKFGFQKPLPFIGFILFWIFLYLMINVIKLQSLGWTFNRFIFLFHPWTTTLFAFSLFLSIKSKVKWIVPFFISWIGFLVFNITRPSVLEESAKLPLWWLPENNLYVLNLVWLLMCYAAIGYILFYCWQQKKESTYFKSLIFYYLYVALLLLQPLFFAILQSYKFEPGEDPLGIFNTLSLQLNSESGHWMLSSLLCFYLGYLSLFVGIFLSIRTLINTKYSIFNNKSSNETLRSQLKGKHLDYFDRVVSGMTNEEIASEMNTDRATVSKQLYNIKRKLELKEDLRSHLKR